MRTPDKIFLGIYTSTLLKKDVLHSEWFEEQQHFVNENVPYIRKDYLLDWLKQSKQEMEEDLKGTDGLKMAMIATAISSFQEVIEKLESL